MAVSFLFHFPSAFAAWGFPSVLPFGVRTFLGPALAARGHPACTMNGSAGQVHLRSRMHGTTEQLASRRRRGRVSRVAVIGDVHGNALAFAAVLEEIRPTRRISSSSTATSRGAPEPEETLALADELADALFVRGNAESALLRLAREPSVDEARRGWMLERHSPRAPRQIERSQAPSPSTVDGVGRVFVCHGSPRGDQELVTPGTPDERMRALLAGTELDVLVTAHVHLQFERQVLGITSMNAGSVGLQYGGTPAAYWAEIGPEISLGGRPTTSTRQSAACDRAGSRPPIASFRRSASLPRPRRSSSTPSGSWPPTDSLDRTASRTPGQRDRAASHGACTNSPQTRHSRLAPRSSAKSSCSSERLSSATCAHQTFLNTPTTLPSSWTWSA